MEKMVDMARKRENNEATIASPAVSKKPEYPYGLQITLDADSLKKLGITGPPTVGDEMHIMAVAKVTSTSQNANESNQSSRAELQIVKMTVTGEAEDKSTTKEENSEVYGGKMGVRFK